MIFELINNFFKQMTTNTSLVLLYPFYKRKKKIIIKREIETLSESRVLFVNPQLEQNLERENSERGEGALSLPFSFFLSN